LSGIVVGTQMLPASVSKLPNGEEEIVQGAKERTECIKCIKYD